MVIAIDNNNNKAKQQRKIVKLLDKFVEWLSKLSVWVGKGKYNFLMADIILLGRWW